MKEGLEKHFEEPAADIVAEAINQKPQEDAQKHVQEQDEVQDQVNAQEETNDEKEEVVIEDTTVAGLEDVVEEDVAELTVQKTIEKKPEVDLPENVQKLVSFLNENPGTNLEDYVNLNKSYDDFDEKTLLREYYNQTKKHLDPDDVNYLLAKKFDIDVEALNEEEARERKIALKEELSDAKNHLNANKDKYYADLKSSAGSADNNEELTARQEEATKHFQSETDKVFEGFKGFTFDLGEGNKKVRYKVDNAEKLKDYQSDLNNVLSDYLEDGKMKDAAGYHKALFAAKNSDKIAQLFYEQGKADAIKNATKDSKNLDFAHTHRAPESSTKLNPGQAREIETPHTGGPKVSLKYWK